MNNGITIGVVKKSTGNDSTKFPTKLLGIITNTNSFDDILNNTNLVVEKGEAPILIVTEKPSKSNTQVSTKHYLWKLGSGNFSPIGSNDIQSKLELINEKFLGETEILEIINNPTAEEIPLGVITEDFITYMNNNGPYGLTDSQKTYIITFTKDSIDYAYIFQGLLRIYGAGFPDLIIEDFIFVYNSTNTGETKLDKSTTHSSVYATDASGDQTMIPLSDFDLSTKLDNDISTYTPATTPLSGTEKALIHDGTDFKKVDVDKIGLKGVFLGSITPTDSPTGSGEAFWIATENGTYTNFGGVVVNPNSYAFISRDEGNNFSISQTPIDLSNYIQKSEIVTYPAGKNKFNKSTALLGKYIDTSTGVLTNGAGAITTDYIECFEEAIYFISGLVGDNFALGIAFYDENKTYISKANSSSNVTFYRTPPAPTGARFFRQTIKSTKVTDTTNIDNVQIELNFLGTSYEDYSEKIISIDDRIVNEHTSTKGIKIVAFGDSILETQNTFGSYVNNWFNYAIGKLDCIVKNYAKSGASYKDTSTTLWQRISYQLEQAEANDPTADLVFFSCGTNDGINAIGDYTTAMSKVLITDLDRLLLYEALRYAFWKARLLYPNAKIFVTTPVQRMSNTTAELTNLYTAIKTMAREYNCEIIDATNEIGIVRQFEVLDGNGRFLADGLHLNPDGKILASNYYTKRIIDGYKNFN